MMSLLLIVLAVGYVSGLLTPAAYGFIYDLIYPPDMIPNWDKRERREMQIRRWEE